MELTYIQVGDYLLPNLVMDPQPEGDIGAWGRRRKRYLKACRNGTYTAMVLKGTLTQDLMDIDEAAQDMMDDLVAKMAKAEGVTEKLKRCDQLAWVQRMNSIRSRAEEIVRHELIEV